MSYHFRIPLREGPHCGVCGAMCPEHYPDCPVLTGEAVHGAVLPPGVQDQLAQQQAMGQNLLGQQSLAGLGPAQQNVPDAWASPLSHYLMEFVGGPLDGPNYVHPAQNVILKIEGDNSGYYECSLGKYYWIRK